MADDKDIKNEQELNKQRQEGIGYIDQARKIAALLTSENRALSEELRDQLGIRQRQNDFDKALLKVSRDIAAASEQNAVALGRSGDLAKAILKDQLTLENALREAEISKIGLGQTQQKIAQEVVKRSAEALEYQDKIEAINQEITEANEEQKNLLEAKRRELINEQAIAEDALANAYEILKPEGQRFALALQLTAQAQKNVNVKALEEAVQNRINDSMGVTGTLIKSAKGAMDQLGMSSLGNLLNIDKANAELKEQIDLIERASEVNGQIEYNGQKMSKAMAITSAKAGAFKNMLSGAFKSATSLEATIGFTLKSLLAASDTQAKFQKMTGMSASAAYGLKTEMAVIANLSGSNFITSQKLVKTYAMMTEQLGMAASAFSGDTLVDVTYMTEKLHLSAEAATQLATMSELNGKSSKQTNKELGKQLSTFNKQNKTMFSLKDLMSDIGTASKAMVLTLGKSPKALMNAAAQARKLGTNLGGVEKIADSLLDFESSIEKEMEAQLITGKQLNLSTAREAAMRGDMATVAKEVANQEAIREAFATNNVIAQQAAAEAIGLSREELAEMTYQQELLELGADKFKDKYGEVAYENAKAQGAQDKFNDAMTKMQSILGDVIGAFSPILDIFAKLMSFPLTPYIMAAVVASKALGGNFFSMFKDIGGIGTKIKDMGSSLLGLGGQAADAGKDIAGKAAAGAGDALSKGATGAVDAAGSAANVKEPKASGEKLKEFFQGLAEGLKSMASMEVVKGALALIPAAIGLTAMIPGAVGAKLVERINGGKLQEGLEGLAKGLGAMAEGKALAGSLVALLASPGIIALGLAAPGLLLLSMIPGPALSATLSGLGTGLAALGTSLMGPQLIGLAAGLALLTGAIIGIGYAIGLAAPAIQAIGSVITAVLGGVTSIITAIADGFTKLLGAISFEKAAAVGVLGLNLLGLAAGTIALGATLPFLPLAALGIIGLSYALRTFDGMDLSKAFLPIAELAKNAGGLLALGPALASVGLGIAALALSAPFMPLAVAGLLGLGYGLKLIAPAIMEALPALKGLASAGDAIGKFGKGMLAAGMGIAALGAGAAMLALFGPIAAIGITAFAVGIAAAGVLIIPAIPGMLAFAAAMFAMQPALELLADKGPGLAKAAIGLGLLGPAMIGLGIGAFALTMAAPFILGAAGAITVLTGAIAVFNATDPTMFIGAMTQFAGIGPGLIAAGVGLFAASGGLIAFSAASYIAAASSLAMMIALWPVEKLASLSEPLSITANSLTQIATALAQIQTALNAIDSAKIDELKDLVITTAFAAPMVAAAGAITSLINGVTGGGGEESSDTVLAEKLDAILAAIQEGGDVYMDGNKVGESLMLSSVKSS